MKKTQILLADDHAVVRRGLRLVIEGEWGWEVCGEAVNGREAVSLVETLKPDVVVIDVGMPELNGVEATRQIRRTNPETEILVFTGQESETLIHQLFAAGARGCVLKNDAGEHIVPAIKALCRHEPYLSSRISQMVFERYLKGGMQATETASDLLTPREREIVQLLSEGQSNKDVATKLGISVATAETHRAAVMKKLGFKAFSELVRYAVRNHIVEA